MEGKCRVPTPTSEVCDLTLTTQNTTIKVPVESRSSGVFPLDVSLWTPDGSQLLARDRDTVRSTAVSGVGIVLMAVAVVSLGLWWGRAAATAGGRDSWFPPREQTRKRRVPRTELLARSTATWVVMPCRRSAARWCATP